MSCLTSRRSYVVPRGTCRPPLPPQPGVTGRSAYMAPTQEQPESGPAEQPARTRRNRTSPDRVQRSFYLSRDLVDRARAAVWATMQRPGEAYNVSQLAGRGLEAEVRRLEA